MTGPGTASGSAAVSVAFDNFITVPEYVDLRDAFDAGDWQRFEAGLNAISIEEVSYAMSLFAEVPGVEEFLETAVAAHPQSSAARTALAMRHIVRGWEARGNGPAQQVSAQSMTRFREWLMRAEQLLIEVCADRTPYAPAWVARVLTARALEVGGSEARRRYTHLTRLSPDNFPGAAHMLQYLLPKWLGSNDEAKTFVHETVQQAPAGSNCGALVALQHLERWSELGGEKAGKAYLSQSSVTAELRGAANRSVLHPDHVASPLGVQAHSAFAMVFWLGGRSQDSAVHLRALDGRASEYPWNLAGAAAVNECYAEVLGGAGRASG